jgi:hypothetical protein
MVKEKEKKKFVYLKLLSPGSKLVASSRDIVPAASFSNLNN